MLEHNHIYICMYMYYGGQGTREKRALLFEDYWAKVYVNINRLSQHHVFVQIPDQ